MKIGYERITAADLKISGHSEMLKAAGCHKIFTDDISSKENRPGLDKALAFAKHGDTIVVRRLDKLGYSIKNLLSIVDAIKTRKLELVSLEEAIDTTNAQGRMLFSVLETLATFENNLTKERTSTGLAAARARGRNGGRPGLSAEKIALAKTLHQDSSKSIKEICDQLGIHPSTLHKYVSMRPEKEAKK
jgi:DNA invertase Pin-like site-specific DNA recombinase